MQTTIGTCDPTVCHRHTSDAHIIGHERSNWSQWPLISFAHVQVSRFLSEVEPLRRGGSFSHAWSFASYFAERFREGFRGEVSFAPPRIPSAPTRRRGTRQLASFQHPIGFKFITFNHQTEVVQMWTFAWGSTNQWVPPIVSRKGFPRRLPVLSVLSALNGIATVIVMARYFLVVQYCTHQMVTSWISLEALGSIM